MKIILLAIIFALASTHQAYAKKKHRAPPPVPYAAIGVPVVTTVVESTGSFLLALTVGTLQYGCIIVTSPVELVGARRPC